jgi:hypothetical protein
MAKGRIALVRLCQSPEKSIPEKPISAEAGPEDPVERDGFGERRLPGRVPARQDEAGRARDCAMGGPAT